MEMRPVESENPVLVAFKKITTQLEKLEERDLRAEERARNAYEREQKLIERQELLYRSEVALAKEVLSFKNSVGNIEVRMKDYLSNYFKDLPKHSLVIEEKRWSIEPNTQRSIYIFLFGMFMSGLLVYFASPYIDMVRLEYQSQRINELEAKLNYMEAKNPKTARSYEVERVR
jgi:hypothetical protein